MQRILRKRQLERFIPWSVPILLILIWQLLVQFGWLSTRVLPAPTAVLQAGIHLWSTGELLHHVVVSSTRAITGLLIGGGIGFMLGILNGISSLAENPRLLLLDEPLGALDALTRIEMQRLIERLWQEQQFTALLVTHDVEEAVTLADRVVLIEAGQITMDLPITLSRPRQRGDASFAAMIEHILNRVLNTGASTKHTEINKKFATLFTT